MKYEFNIDQLQLLQDAADLVSASFKQTDLEEVILDINIATITCTKKSKKVLFCFKNKFDTCDYHGETLVHYSYSDDIELPFYKNPKTIADKLLEKINKYRKDYENIQNTINEQKKSFNKIENMLNYFLSIEPKLSVYQLNKDNLAKTFIGSELSIKQKKEYNSDVLKNMYIIPNDHGAKYLIENLSKTSFPLISFLLNLKSKNDKILDIDYKTNSYFGSFELKVYFNTFDVSIHKEFCELAMEAMGFLDLK